MAANQKKPIDCPLHKHKNGQWRKKIRGKHRYFGTDLDEALVRYERERPFLERGIEPRSGFGIKLHELLDLYVYDADRRLEIREISKQHYDGCVRTGELLVESLTREIAVCELNPDDFEAMRTDWCRRFALSTAEGHIRRARMIFKWACDFQHVLEPVDMGTRFVPPSRKQKKLDRKRRPKEMWTANELWTLQTTAGVSQRAMILLAINCGFIPCDIGRLRWSDVRAVPGWLELMREKTGVDRRAPLWPETQEALVAVANLTGHHAGSLDDLVFRTKAGNPYWRDCTRSSPISQNFRQLWERCKIDKAGRTFKSIRKTFQTVADQKGDYIATKIIMGHADHSISDIYRQEFSKRRLMRVAKHVRKWFLRGRPKLQIVGEDTQSQAG